MTTFTADPTILNDVRTLIAEVLTLDNADEVKADSSLMDDLGADSLDLLELVFKLEEHFGLKIQRGEIVKAAQGDLPDEEFAAQGKVTEKGLERLRFSMPEVPPARFTSGLPVTRVAALFTPTTFARIVMMQKTKQA